MTRPTPTTRLTQALVALAFALPLFTAARPAAAQGAPAQGFGIGLEVGTIVGIDGKWWLNERNALQFALAFDYSYDHGTATTVDYLWHPSVLTSGGVMRLLWHIGIGGAIGFGDNYYHNGTHYTSDIGVRIPIGLDMLFNQQPIDVFLEISPTVFVAPVGFFDAWGALGARFYF